MSDRFDDLVKNSIRAADHDEAADWIPPAVAIKPPPPGVPVNALAATQTLLDLIAELREAHHAEQYTLTDGHYCPICQTRASRMSSKSVDWPCDTARMADRAEARLREVGGDE